MARKRFGELTQRSQEKIAREGAEYGLTRRQARERYNRGTFNPLARTPERKIPQRAPYYPVASGQSLKDQAYRNIAGKLGDRLYWNPEAVRSALDKHTSDVALRRMAGASEDELTAWAEYQRKYSYKPNRGSRQVTPDWLRDLGWSKDGKWRNPFWYH